MLCLAINKINENKLSVRVIVKVPISETALKLIPDSFDEGLIALIKLSDGKKLKIMTLGLFDRITDGSLGTDAVYPHSVHNLGYVW